MDFPYSGQAVYPKDPPALHEGGAAGERLGEQSSKKCAGCVGYTKRTRAPAHEIGRTTLKHLCTFRRQRECGSSRCVFVRLATGGRWRSERLASIYKKEDERAPLHSPSHVAVAASMPVRYVCVALARALRASRGRSSFTSAARTSVRRRISSERATFSSAARS